MFDFFFGNSKLKNALKRGAVVIDLRPPGRFDQGHIPDSINIPIDRIPINVARIKEMHVPIILCGDSADIRNARQRLQQYGVKDIYSGGSWTRVYKILQSV